MVDVMLENGQANKTFYNTAVDRVCAISRIEKLHLEQQKAIDRSRGRPWKTWCEVLRNDLKLSGLRVEDAENRTLWRSKTKTMQHHTRELSGSVTLMDSECECEW